MVFHFIVVPCCPKSQKPRDVDKRLQAEYFVASTELGIFGAAEGRMEKNFHLIVVPCCPIFQSQSISPSWAFRGIDKAGLGILGLDGERWFCLSTLFHSFPFLHCAGLETLPQVPIVIHAIAGNGMRRLNNVITTHDHYKMEATCHQKE